MTFDRTHSCGRGCRRGQVALSVMIATRQGLPMFPVAPRFERTTTVMRPVTPRCDADARQAGGWVIRQRGSLGRLSARHSSLNETWEIVVLLHGWLAYWT